MKQVPGKYLIIGSGRLALHLATYFQLLKIPFVTWNRSHAAGELSALTALAPRILLAIKDDAIESFIKEHALPAEKTIHFSGALSTPRAIRLHPLMTFATTPYALADYVKIPFVGERGAPPLRALIPELGNPYFAIEKDSEDLYHALCVLGGNGTVVLWQQVFKMFEERLGLPAEVLKPYLVRVCQNLAAAPHKALTGPWVRGDLATISKNQNALKSTPYLNLYSSLLSTYQATRDRGADDIRSPLC